MPDTNDYLIRTDALQTKTYGLVYDTSDPRFVDEIVEAVCWGETVKIFDYPTRQFVNISPSQINPNRRALAQVNAILKAHGIRPPRGRRT
jgi:hypothetical protein